MISLLPARVIKLLEFIGFSGNKQTGMDDLMRGCKMNGLRQVLIVMVRIKLMFIRLELSFDFF